VNQFAKTFLTSAALSAAATLSPAHAELDVAKFKVGAITIAVLSAFNQYSRSK
jgi:hypothetical protein